MADRDPRADHDATRRSRRAGHPQQVGRTAPLVESEIDLARRIANQEERRLRARRNRRPVWFGLGVFGLIGWSIAVPAVVGALFGLWVDRRWPGPISWALSLLLIGVVFGCFNAWRWVAREQNGESS